MTFAPKGFIDVTAIPWDDHMSQSFLALLSKLRGKECLTHVDTEGSGHLAAGCRQNREHGGREKGGIRLR